jgi:hypothetical protein
MNLSQRDRGRLTATLSMTIGLLTETDASAEEFVEAARGKIFDPAHEGIALALAAAIVSRRPGLNDSLGRRRLAISVLPYLTQFEITVDLRIRVENEQVEDGVALAIVHIDTDSNNQELWMQLTRLDIENIQAKLTDALNKMTMAEQLVKRQRETGE